MKKINFKHDYFKLQKNNFTTIRSKNHLKKHDYKVGEYVIIVSPSYKFIAQIVGIDIKRICDIDLKDLKEDGEYENFTINSHDDFVNLLNSFVEYPGNKITTEKVIIHLKKIM